MNYYTIKNITEMTSVPVHHVCRENKWVVIVLNNGVRIKIKDF